MAKLLGYRRSPSISRRGKWPSRRSWQKKRSPTRSSRACPAPSTCSTRAAAIRWNEAQRKLTGLPEDRMLQSSVLDVVHSEDPQGGGRQDQESFRYRPFIDRGTDRRLGGDDIRIPPDGTD